MATMEIDTQAVRTLRDALMAQGRLCSEDRAPGGLAPDQQDAVLRRVEPFVETMYLVLMADQEETQSEWDAVRGAIRVFTEGLLSEKEIEAMLERVAERRIEQGAAARLQILGAHLCVDPADREAAFALAAVAALADDTLVLEENRLLEEMADWYGISTRRRLTILQELGRGL